MYKKRLLLPLLLLLIFSACKDEKSLTDLDANGLKGRVKTIITSSGEQGSIDKESMFEYNSEGYLEYKEEYLSQVGWGPQQINTETKRNKQNIKTEEVINYIYDGLDESESRNRKNTKKYIYDENNQLIEIIEFSSENKIVSDCVLKYDDKGNVISEIFKVEDGNQSHKYKYKYDGDFVTEKIDENIHLKSTSIYKYKYNTNGNKIEEIDFDADGIKLGELKYSYDNKNNLIEVKYTEKEKLIFTSKYEYDEVGNWIKKTESYTADEPAFITTRKIEYYSEDEIKSPEINNSKTEENSISEDIDKKVIENDNLTFQGQALKAGEKIIKINWGKENKAKTSKDIFDDLTRYSSNSLKVPNGKKWILIYINEDYTNDILITSSVPGLFIDNSEYPIGGRMFSNKNNINLSRAKDENIKIYAGSTIRAVSSDQFGKGRVEDKVEYKGEIWFLEIND